MNGAGDRVAVLKGLMMGRMADPTPFFRHRYYFRLNMRRLEHLTSLGLPLSDRTVFEVGAGIGDHTEYFLDRGCRVTSTEARQENLEFLRRRYRRDSRVEVRELDMDDLPECTTESWEVTYCYGLLYHLIQPGPALEFLGGLTSDLLLLETMCAYGESEAVNLVEESTSRCSQSLRGQGCRPTRIWVMNRLRSLFEYVYCPRTQPWHDEFQIDWREKDDDELWLGRAVFIASREPLDNPLLSTELPVEQRRH